jgi:pyruvate kinase
MKSKRFELLCTLGPASLNDRVVYCLERAGASLLRVNLSHTKVEELERIIRFVQDRSEVPICLDTEGAQLRTGPMVDGRITVRENRFLTVHAKAVPGDPLNISLNPGDLVEKLEVGDFVSIDFNSVLSQVVEMRPGAAVLRIMHGGDIGQNKAVTVLRPLEMAPLTEKDLASIEIGRRLGIRHYALSFAHRDSDVDLIRDKAGPGSVIISKIECLTGLANLAAIARKSDAILIDRGDLSREIPIEQIPAVQKMIIREGRACGTKIYVATNLLESMTAAPTPTRAEVNDIYNTLADGADGLVLAAETAIGQYPVDCARMVVKVMRQFERQAENPEEPSAAPPAWSLNEPHGGRLACREPISPDDESLAGLPQIVVDDEELTDVEQLTRGTYSPLSGFMDLECLGSVLECHRLPTGLVWTMPIVLAVRAEAAWRVGRGDRVLLVRRDGLQHSVLEVTSSFRFDSAVLARRWFGTDASDHPGAARVMARGDHFLSGEVTLVNPLPLACRLYDMTPQQLRTVFAHKGWSRVVGFHSRNIVHRGHEAVQLAALERTHADGLLISPILAATRRGDFMPEVVLEGYQAMLDYGLYPSGRVMLAGIVTYPRFAGSREAVFTALCRKNMGCSHFIVGRDHAGVSGADGTERAKALFDTLGDVGIEPVFFDEVGYDVQSERYVEVSKSRGAATISGTDIRRAINEGVRLPTWMMRPEVQAVVRAKQKSHARLFQE